MNFKKWSISFLALFLSAVLIMGTATAVVDPFFHYHKPLSFLQYEINYERYQNDGIVKHFDYDTLITGNSMSENFKASECDALFSATTVKAAFSGASPKEIDMNNRAAVKANPELKRIIMNLDWGNFVKDKDYMSYEDDDYHDYLYNENPFDDVKYLFNKNIFGDVLRTISYTLSGQKTTTMDDYAFWDDDPDTVYGWDAICAQYEPNWYHDEVADFGEEQYEVLFGNLTQNIISLANENPQIDFYLFMPPYSMFFWAKMYNVRELEFQFDAQQAAIELLLECENIHLFSFIDEFDLAQDYSRYKDYIHYDADVNSRMLECMANGDHQLTKDNYNQYLDRCREFYLNYDYEGLLDKIYSGSAA